MPSSIAKPLLAANDPVLLFRRRWVLAHVRLVPDGQTEFVSLHAGDLVEPPAVSDRAYGTFIFCVYFIDLVVSHAGRHESFVFFAK